MDELLSAEEIENRLYDREKELENIKAFDRSAHPDYIKRLRTEIQAYKTAIKYAA